MPRGAGRGGIAQVVHRGEETDLAGDGAGQAVVLEPPAQRGEEGRSGAVGHRRALTNAG